MASSGRQSKTKCRVHRPQPSIETLTQRALNDTDMCSGSACASTRALEKGRALSSLRNDAAGARDAGHVHVEEEGRVGLVVWLTGVLGPVVRVVVARVSQQQRVAPEERGPALADDRFEGLDDDDRHGRERDALELVPEVDRAEELTVHDGRELPAALLHAQPRGRAHEFHVHLVHAPLHPDRHVHRARRLHPPVARREPSVRRRRARDLTFAHLERGRFF